MNSGNNNTGHSPYPLYPFINKRQQLPSFFSDSATKEISKLWITEVTLITERRNRVIVMVTHPVR